MCEVEGGGGGGGGRRFDKVDQCLMPNGKICETENQKWMNQPVLNKGTVSRYF